MTETKKQLLDSAVTAVEAYKNSKNWCALDSDERKQYKAEAVAACQAYADYSGIAYERACQVVMELF